MSSSQHSVSSGPSRSSSRVGRMSDASLSTTPANSFAHLRSQNRGIIRDNSISALFDTPGSVTVATSVCSKHSSRQQHAAQPANAHPILARRFPALRKAGLAAKQRAQSASTTFSESIRRRAGDSSSSSAGGGGGHGKRRSRLARSASAASTSGRVATAATAATASSSASGRRRRRRRKMKGSKSSSRLFDPELTASALPEIDWLPRFKQAVAYNAKHNPLPGASASLAMSGTLKLIRRKDKTQVAKELADRPAFKPSGTSAKKAIASGNKGFTGVDTPYNALAANRVKEEKASRQRFLHGDWAHNSGQSGKEGVEGKVFLNSPDEMAMYMMQEELKQRIMLSTAQYVAQGVGRSTSRSRPPMSPVRADSYILGNEFPNEEGDSKQDMMNDPSAIFGDEDDQ